MQKVRRKSKRMAFFGLLALALLLIIGIVPAFAATSVFINEIHYDNASTDVGEAIEIAGPAGTDLSGWSLVFYNGSGGASYGTLSLSGVIPDQGGGYGTLAFAYSGIQNGSPDGLALVAPGNAVVQFLSYEGSFVAVGGPAAGMTSVDIGVTESSSAAVGDSLQLVGTGTMYEDFTWAGSAPNTFGGVNSGQQFLGAPVAPALVINEVDYDQPSTDAAEYVEIMNVGAGAADLSLVTLELVNGTGGGATVYDTIALPAILLAPGDYFVVCANAGTVANCDLDDGPDTNFIQNGAPDAVGLRWDGNLLDAVSYEGDSGAPYTEGSGAGLADLGDPDMSIARCPDGSDSDQNNVDFTYTAGTPGAANSCGGGPFVPPDVIINEMDADTPGSDAAEFVELYDYGVGNTDLSGLVLVLFNGNGDISYAAFDLDGYSTDGDGYFLAGNAGVAPAPGLVFANNTLQNGADAIALYVGNAADFPNGSPVTTANLIDAIVYDTNDPDDIELLALLNAGQPQVDEGGNGDKDNHSNQRCPNGDGGPRNTDTYAQYAASPGVENPCGTGGPTFGVCYEPATPIHAIQGNGLASPEVGFVHVIEGVVVGDYQDTATELRGFFLQEEDAEADADPTTSEGIFVYDNGFGADVVVGDVVRVMGTVTEFFDLTELTDITNLAICNSGAAVTPTTITLPIPAISDWEYNEGMLVTINQELTVTSNYTWGRYGEVELSVGGRLFNPTNVTTPGPAANALQDLNNRSRIQLDDASTVQNPLPYPPYLGPGNTLRAGDTLPSLSGVLNYGFGDYQIEPVGPVDFTRVNNRPPAPAPVGGTLTVASMNVLNYFVTLDGSGPICGPYGSQDCRGADNIAEFQRQRAKIVSAIVSANADVIGLMEMENHPTDAALQDLVSGVNDVAGAGTYAALSTGTIGTDAIKVALIYKPATVTPAASFAILDSAVDPAFIDFKNRPVLAQTFMENANGALFTVAVNHLKSKGSACDDVGDPNAFDGQGNCNLTRTNAAIAEVNWLASDPTGSGDPDFIIVGDLNAYALEDPITAIKNAGYTNLIESFLGADAYSYSFDGQYGYLDHALSNASLTAQVAGVTEWHINADEPAALDYNDFNQPLLYNPDPYRASDHDPVLVGLDLNAPPVCAAAVPSIAEIWPVNHEFVAVDIWDVYDPDGDPVAISISSIWQDEPVDSNGDGSFTPDGQGLGTSVAEVRAERAGGDNGRFYHITFLAEDNQGNACSGAILVSVPESQGKNGAAVDDGALYDSTIP